MTAWTYRAMWPIEDDTRTASALVAEASASLDAMARAAGVRITGQPEWTVAGGCLVCDVSAEPCEPAPPRDEEIVRLYRLGWTTDQIAAVMQVGTSTVGRVILAGCGRRRPARKAAS